METGLGTKKGLFKVCPNSRHLFMMESIEDLKCLKMCPGKSLVCPESIYFLVILDSE